jgi:hypothetical protein
LRPKIGQFTVFGLPWTGFGGSCGFSGLNSRIAASLWTSPGRFSTS